MIFLSIRFFKTFTEHNQNLFIGDSVTSPLLAVFSGLMYKDGYSVRRIPEIVAQSGSALLHFYSDVAYNMTGFNISYR